MCRPLLLSFALLPALALAQGSATPQYSARVVTSVVKNEAPVWRTWKGDLCSVNYPGNWSMDDTGRSGALVSFLAPVDSARRFREHVLLFSEERPGHTMAALAEENAQELRRANAEILENTVDEDTQTLIYRTRLNGQSMHCKRTILKHGDTILTLTYVAAPERYEEELFRADALVNSLQFLK